MKKIILLLITMILALSCSYAYAGTSTNQGSTSTNANSDIYNVIDFKFHHFENGIGYGSCPVYTAPSTNAFRCANGKASVDTNHDMWVAGFDQTGWIMVRYDTNNGGCRVGYVPANYVSGFKTSYAAHNLETLKFSYIKQTATGNISVTDNPLMQNSAFATLSKGETYYILGKYTYYGNWWYIECEVDGQVARGFINRSTTAVDTGNGQPTTNLGYPTRSPLGTTQMCTVTIMGDGKIVRQNAGTNYEMVARVNNYEKYPAYASKIGDTGKEWYYIYVDGVWGWISSGVVRVSY